MPRGGSGPGGHNNHLSNTSATPAELSAMTSFIMDIIETSKPDLHDINQVNAAIHGYFANCQKHGTKPGNMGLYAALGITRQDYNNALTGKSKAKLSPAALDAIKNAVLALSAYRENLALENKIHPTTYIFMGKNHDGLEDYTRIEVSADSKQAPTMTPDQIAKQIEADIPIDSDYKEL